MRVGHRLLAGIALPVALLVLPGRVTPQQQSYVPTLTLMIKNTVQVPSQSRRPVMEPVRCDSEGNVYVRGYQFPRPKAAPVLKFSADGKNVVTFSLDSAPGFAKGTPFDAFAVGPRGEVFVLTFKNKDELDLVSFRKDGEYDSAAKVELLFIPAQVVVFPSGEFLASGVGVPNKEGGPVGEPLTAMFDRNGRLITKVARGAGTTSEQQQSKAQPGQLPPQVSLAKAEVGDDGNVYLMGSAVRPTVLVISPAGKVVRRLELRPPSPAAKPWAMKVGGGKIIIEFTETDNHGQQATTGFSAYDAEDGNLSAEYVSPPELGGALACYSPNGFTFLSARNGHFAIIKAVPR